MMSRRHGLLFALGWALVACQGDDPALPGDRVDLGSHQLQLRIEGEGTPAVVIDSGIAADMESMRGLQQLLAASTRIVCYDRAGYGRSDPGPLPRDAGREADELKALLERASIPGPWVLVGHSLGALNVQVFADRHPDEVAGLVLLDPPPLSFLSREAYAELGRMAEQMTAEWQGIADSADEEARRDFFRMIASEHREMFGETARQVNAIASFGDLPLAVIAAGRPNPAFGDVAEEFQRFWIEQSRALSGKSTRGCFVLAEDSTHHLQEDAPELVADGVRTVLKMARGD